MLGPVLPVHEPIHKPREIPVLSHPTSTMAMMGRTLSGAVEHRYGAVLWMASSDQPVQREFELCFVDRLDDKIGVLQRRANGLRGEEYLRLNIFTCMITKT